MTKVLGITNIHFQVGKVFNNSRNNTPTNTNHYIYNIYRDIMGFIGYIHNR